MKYKRLFIVLLIGIFGFIALPIGHLLQTKSGETSVVTKLPHGFTNDASQLNLTKIDTIIQFPSDPQQIQQQLTQLLAYAKSKQLKISIAGAQHSMGGHSIYPNGVVVDMRHYNHMHFNTTTQVLRIGSGALWQDALTYLDGFGKSIAIMQAFSSFTVGGSLSVNGHGWQKDSPPISDSVLGFTLMTADGKIQYCSREENAELFALALGGYGLFGIILEVDLRVVDNRALQLNYVRLHPNDYLQNYKALVSANPKVNLVFGRLRISDKHFFEEATLTYFEEVDAAIPLLSQRKSTATQRLVFRGSVNNEYGKRLRWDLETAMNSATQHTVYSRNELLNDAVDLIENRDPLSTDILQEYFVPEANFNQFIAEIKPILRNSPIDLLNVTIRGVQHDTDSFLNYAQQDVFGFVLLFNQKKTAEQEQQMQELTNQLLDVALQNQGTFYLPYRLHIDKEKMRKAYPQAGEFFALKRKHDPDTLFNNAFYLHYH